MILRFKTTINCGGCVAKVTPFLNNQTSISQWQVDTAHPDKILTVSGETVDASAVAETVQKAGFKIQLLP